MLIPSKVTVVRFARQHILELLLFVAALSLVCQLSYPFYVGWINQPYPGNVVKQQFQWNQDNQHGQRNLQIGYWLYLPREFEQKEEWPLVIYLHGTGGRGYDLDRIRTVGPLNTIRMGKQLPAIVAVPQCPTGRRWRATLVTDLLNEVFQNHKVDDRKVYLTGYSMGGFGTWEIGSQLPGKFAALIPLAGGGDTEWASTLAKKPIWAFHGAKDKIVAMERSKEMVKAIELAGGSAKFTIFPEAGHSINSLVYEDPNFWEWLFEQELVSVTEE